MHCEVRVITTTSSAPKSHMPQPQSTHLYSEPLTWFTIDTLSDQVHRSWQICCQMSRRVSHGGFDWVFRSNLMSRCGRVLSASVSCSWWKMLCVWGLNLRYTKARLMWVLIISARHQSPLNGRISFVWLNISTFHEVCHNYRIIVLHKNT